MTNDTTIRQKNHYYRTCQNCGKEFEVGGVLRTDESCSRCELNIRLDREQAAVKFLIGATITSLELNSMGEITKIHIVAPGARKIVLDVFQFGDPAYIQWDDVK